MSNNLYKRNRKKVLQSLKPNSVAVILSNDIMPKNADGEFAFYQNNDLLYLTGVNYPETSLILVKDSKSNTDELLFIKQLSDQQKLWRSSIDIDFIKQSSQIEKVYFETEFRSRFIELAFRVENIYLNLNEATREKYLNTSQNFKFAIWCKENFPLHKYDRLAPIMKQHRKIKEPEELENLQKACILTGEAFKKAMKIIKNGIYEYDVEAEFIYHFTKSGTGGFAFPPIIASGKNSCILHYLDNNSKLHDGETILIDLGVKYKHYNSDISRVFPINGRFTKRQKEVYTSVLEVLKYGKSIIKSGVNFCEYLDEVYKKMESELIKLNLIKTKDDKERALELKKYFMHGVSHHLGLDVHDDRFDKISKMQENMVITIEPGIYIKEENLGIRLENDILITNDGIKDFCEDIPIEIEEIEDIMNKD